MKKFAASILITMIITGCASVPKESVELNNIIGQALTKQHESQVSLVNQYFALKRERIDEFIQQTYTPKIIENARIAMKNDGKKDFDNQGVIELLKIVLKKQLAMQKELEESRLFILEKIEQDYLEVALGNKAITQLLQSLVSVQESKQNFVRVIETTTNNKLDLSTIDSTIENFLQQTKNDSSTTVKLLNTFKSLLEGKK